MKKLWGRYLTFISLWVIILIKDVDKLARTARIKDIHGIYYINQLGTEERNLFSDDLDRDKFLSILNTSKEKNDFKLYAYCLLNPNEYHLIIGANGADISKIMKEINISYAMYVAHPSSIYRDRYRSQLIQDKDQLLSILNDIHATGKKIDSKYNSYCFFNEDISSDGLLDKIDFELLIQNGDCLIQKSECKDCIKTMEKALARLNEIANCKDLTIDELMANKPLRNDLIKQFRRESTLSLKELGKLFGDLSESTICKILNNR